MPVQNKAIPDDNGIQQPSFVENVLLKLLFFFKIQGWDLALKLRVDFKRINCLSLKSSRTESDRSVPFIHPEKVIEISCVP